MAIIEYDGFKLEKSDGIGILTLARPEKLNALTARMAFLDFPKFFKELQYDDEVRVLIITGAGKAFCSGFEVGDMALITGVPPEWKTTEKVAPIGYFASPLWQLEKPVIAAINGVAAGAGISIALLSDIRIASENARFIMSFVQRGLIPDGGSTFTMPRLIGAAKSFELMYTGDTVDAEEAERIGLVSKVVPASKLMSEVNALAKKLVKGPPLTLAQIKRAIHFGLTNDLEQQLFFESYAERFLWRTEDFKEGVDSFLEKRDPQFRGR